MIDSRSNPAPYPHAATELPQPPPRPPLPGWTRAAARREALRGAARTLSLVLATLGFGLAWNGALRLRGDPALGITAPAPTAPASDRVSPMEIEGHRPDEAPAAPEPEPEIWLVDGFNVLHAGILKGRDRTGWWRAEPQLRLVARVAGFEALEAALWVVFDAAKPASERCVPGPDLARVNLVFAPSADDWLVRRVRQDEDPTRLAVVSGDRQVTGRARHAGARIVSPRAFLARCPVPEPDTPPA